MIGSQDFSAPKTLTSVQPEGIPEIRKYCCKDKGIAESMFLVSYEYLIKISINIDKAVKIC
jgi:hypothetical protein